MKPTPRSRSSCKTRGRAALLWAVAGFTLMQLGLAGAIEVWLPQLREPVYACKLHLLGERTHSADAHVPTVIMLGTSRTAYGLDAGCLQAQLNRATETRAMVFNFGINGAGPVSELMHLKRLLAAGHRPDLLLIEVMPPLLAGQGPMPPETRWLAPASMWHSDLAVLRHLHCGFQAMRRQWWASWPIPWYTQRFNILSQVMPGWLPFADRKDAFRLIDPSGWMPCPQSVHGPEQLRQVVQLAHQVYGPLLNGLRLQGPACQALGEVLRLCRQHGIGAAMVLMPETTKFRAWYSPTAWARIDAYLNEVGHTFGVPLINAREWIADEHFADAQHLLPMGAALFSQRLAPAVLTALHQRNVANTLGK